MKDDDIVQALQQKCAGLSPTELAQFLDELTDGGLSQSQAHINEVLRVFAP